MHKTQIWAHRGASGYAPENTMRAFQMALDMGADGVELDVQLSKDGELVVIHDETIDRTSDGSGAVKSFTLAELKQFDFGCRFSGNTEITAIPTLAEVLELYKSTDLVINIELKTGIIPYLGIEKKTLDLVNDFGMSERVIYSSFNHYSVLRVKELDQTVKTGLLFGGGHLFMAAAAKALGVDAIHPHVRAFDHPGFIEDCREHGLLVHTWTANSEHGIRQMLKIGVDAMVTNYPDRAEMIQQNTEFSREEYKKNEISI